MNIGEASRASGVPAKTIRYYDEIDLVRPANRTDAKYRKYDERAINELRFVKRARGLGFSFQEIVVLLSLWRDRKRPSREVKAAANRYVEDLSRRMSEIRALADALCRLADSCSSDDRPDYPVLTDRVQASAPIGRANRKPTRQRSLRER